MRSAGFAASFSEFIVNQVKLSDCFAVERLAMGEDPVPALGAPLVAEMSEKRHASSELHYTASTLSTCIEICADCIPYIMLTALVRIQGIDLLLEWCVCGLSFIF